MRSKPIQGRIQGAPLPLLKRKKKMAAAPRRKFREVSGPPSDKLLDPLPLFHLELFKVCPFVHMSLADYISNVSTPCIFFTAQLHSL